MGGGHWGGGGQEGGCGCLAVRVCQANAGSLPRVVGSLCRSGWGFMYPRFGRSFRPVGLCLAEIEPFYWPSDSSNTVIGSVK